MSTAHGKFITEFLEIDYAAIEPRIQASGIHPAWYGGDESDSSDGDDSECYTGRNRNIRE